MKRIFILLLFIPFSVNAATQSLIFGWDDYPVLGSTFHVMCAVNSAPKVEVGTALSSDKQLTFSMGTANSGETVTCYAFTTHPAFPDASPNSAEVSKVLFPPSLPKPAGTTLTESAP